MTGIHIVKRNGDKENLDLEKMHKVVFEACNNINNVSASEVELKSHIQFYSGITSSEIQETLIKAAAELITEDTPNYQWVAGNLINYHIRKEVYGAFEPCHIMELVNKNTKSGFYDKALTEDYSVEEWDKINGFIKHDRDFDISYVGMEQFRGKYLVQNRVTKEVFETPQMAYMLIAATLFSNYPTEERLKWVKDYYDAISTFDISLPTPVMAGVRTPQRQFSSCVLIETDDSLDSINATSSSIVKYVSQKAGIGVGAGSIRAINSPIRNGDASHTGVIPFYKMFQAAVKSCSQGGVRGGAATLYYPVWHYEVEDLLVLKNNKGTEDNRVRHMDYGVQFNKLMYERLMTGGNITLFSPQDVPGLYEAFFNDQDTFRELYEQAERKTSIRKKTVPAIELFSSFMNERKNTGRIYLMNVDHANDHSSFDTSVAPIKQSNLCCEINLPTKPLNSVMDEEGEIALCTLSAINWGNIKSPEDFEKPCELAVRGLDALLSYQDYPLIAAELATDNRRPLGKASNNLAKEIGPCPKSDETKYGHGVVPIDTRKAEIDELVKHSERMDWKGLREDLKEHGVRNSTLMALMPAETSAQISNSTNGIEPPRSYVSIKQSKHGVLKQVVPGIHKLKNKYELLWDQKSPEGYLKIMAVLQKYIDQGISVNTSYNPVHYEDEKIPMSEMLQHLIMFYKYGGKQLYYFNTFDGQGELDIDALNNEPLEPGLIDDEDCEGCTI